MLYLYSNPLTSLRNAPGDIVQDTAAPSSSAVPVFPQFCSLFDSEQKLQACKMLLRIHVWGISVIPAIRSQGVNLMFTNSLAGTNLKERQPASSLWSLHTCLWISGISKARIFLQLNLFQSEYWHTWTSRIIFLRLECLFLETCWAQKPQ